MIQFFRCLCMAVIGIVLATSKVTITTWQFWAIIVAIIAYGAFCNADGASDAKSRIAKLIGKGKQE